MKRELLAHLACPRCGESFTCRDREVDGAEVVEGTLDCAGCRASFPIRRGVPRLLPPALSLPESSTAAAFGTQWKLLGDLSGVFREEFESYLYPLRAADLAGLMVLDAGCGMGKFSLAAAEAGATVIAVDLSEAVDVAHAHLRRFPAAHVVQASIYALPLRPRTFDFVFSIGVLHHLPEPERGFRGLVPLVRPGGRAFAWVYALEGNEFFVRWLDPWRARVFSRLPSRVNRMVTTLLAAPLWALIRTLYVPLARRQRAGRLPYADYFLYFSRLGYGTFWGTVYDKLVPPVSFYLRDADVRRWVHDAGLTDPLLRHRNGNSWSCLARRPSPA